MECKLFELAKFKTTLILVQGITDEIESNKKKLYFSNYKLYVISYHAIFIL